MGFLTLLLGASLTIILVGLHDNLRPADLAVVLGNKVDRDGRPSPMLQARLDHALKLYQQGYFRLVLVSGGHGREGYDESSIMRRYLEAHGIPSDCILEDDTGNTTWLTAQHTARLVRDQHLHSVLIVTQYFHVPRCRLAFARCGIQPVYWSHAPFWSIRDVYSLPREAIGCLVYAARRTT